MTRLPALVAALFSFWALAPARSADPAPDAPLKIHMIAFGEYSPVETLTEFKDFLEKTYRVEITTSFGGNGSKLEGLDGLPKAELLVLFARRMQLKDEQMKIIRAHWDQGKPIIGLRTACHAFQKDDNAIIDRKVFGGNYGGGPSSNGGFKTTVPAGAEQHPVLKDVGTIKASKYAYGQGELAEGVTVLHTAKALKGETIPVTFVNTYNGGRMLYSSLGAPDDFKDESFRKLLVNAVFWATKRDVERMKK